MFLDSFKSRPRFYKTITTLSRTKESPVRTLVTNDKKMFSGDYICKKCKIDNSGSEHSSVDALHYTISETPFTLILVEFKFISAKTYSEEMKIRNIKLSLKLKPLETLFCVLPHLIEKYGVHKDILFEQLIQSKKLYFCVTDYEDENLTREHIFSGSDYFDLDRLSPHPFDETYTLTVDSFQDIVKDVLS